MMQRYTNCLALVLENEDVLYKIMLLEGFTPIAPHTNEFVNSLDRFGSKRSVVIRRVEDDFANAERWLDLINTVRLDRRSFGISLQTWKSILECDDVVVGFGNFSWKL